jgi:hypothetical protein
VQAGQQLRGKIAHVDADLGSHGILRQEHQEEIPRSIALR